MKSYFYKYNNNDDDRKIKKIQQNRILRRHLLIYAPLLSLFLIISGQLQDAESLPFTDNFECVSPQIVEEGKGVSSPNNKWIIEFNGFGETGVITEPSNKNNYFFIKPEVSTSPDETHAGLVTTCADFKDVRIEMDVRTVEQLREGSPPNVWETAWILWHFYDYSHLYGLVLKTNGIELNKLNDEGQFFIATLPFPQFEIGKWYHVKIEHIGDTIPRIKVWIDNTLIIDVVDTISTPNSHQLSQGRVGLYTEDALVNFDNIRIKDIEQ